MYQCLLRLSFNLKQGMAVGEKGVIFITVRNGLKHGIFATVAGRLFVCQTEEKTVRGYAPDSLFCLWTGPD